MRLKFGNRINIEQLRLLPNPQTRVTDTTVFIKTLGSRLHFNMQDKGGGGAKGSIKKEEDFSQEPIPETKIIVLKGD